MKRFQPGDLVSRRTWEDETCDWRIVEGETWVYLGGFEDAWERSFGDFLAPFGSIVRAPVAYFVDEEEARILASIHSSVKSESHE
jgi:hypothetical protein